MKTMKGVARQARDSSTLSAVELSPSRPLATLSDSELLRYGMALKRKAFVPTQVGSGLVGTALNQWKELRREWHKRYPDLPLSATFEDQLG
jgi:hypothetical protein